MSLLKKLTTDASIENETDSVGYAGALDSGVYLVTIELAYVIEAEGGATGLVLNAKTADDREIRQTLWMTSGRAKGSKNYYERDGKKHYLPGFLHAQSLALLTVGKDISDLELETKVVKVYNRESKAEVPTPVEMVVDLLGKEIYLGIQRQTVDRTIKNDAGVYVPTGETREENEIDKLFRASDKLTTAEIRAEATEPAYFNTWSTRFSGKTRDRSTGASSGSSAGAPTNTATTANKKPTSSLFTKSV